VLAVATGATEAAGGKAWEGLSSLVRRWFKPGKKETGGAVEDLERLHLGDGSAAAAARLAKALTDRANTDAAFRAELVAWQCTAQQVYVKSIVIAGNNYGPATMIDRVESLTIQVPPGQRADGTAAPTQDVSTLIGEDAPPLSAMLLVHIGEATMRMPSQPPKSLGGLPPLPRGLTARRGDLAALLDSLDPAADDGASTAAVVGPPGVGKTTLAVEAGYAAKEAGWFPGGVLFLNLHGYDEASLQPEQVVSLALRALGVAAEHIPESSMDEATSLYRSMLADLGEPVLILADNASSSAQVRPLLPGAGGHRVLVTSRLTMPELGARQFSLLPMADAEAVALLNAVVRTLDPWDARITDHPDDAVRLARCCGRLPLALDITARVLMSRPSMTVDQLADQLADRRTRIDQLDQLGWTDEGRRGVRAAFEFSFEQLGPEPKRLLRLCAASPGPDLATDAAIALVGDDRSDAIAALDVLDRAHLIMPTADRSRWQIHDLLREYAEELAESAADADGREQAYDDLLEYYLEQVEDATSALLSANDDAHSAGTTATWRDAAQWFEAERLNLIAATSLAGQTGRTRTAFQLSAHLTGLAVVQHHVDSAETLAEICLAATAQQDDDLPWRAIALTNSAQVQQLAGHTDKVISACREAVRILRDVQDLDEELAATLVSALAGLGCALLESDQQDAAIATLEEAVAEARNHRIGFMEVQALVRLGAVLAKMRRYEEALTIQRQAAVAADATGSALHRGVALIGLGGTLHAADRYDEAVVVALQAAGIFREMGLIYMEMLAQDSLGDMLWDAGKREEALNVHRRVAELARQTGNAGVEATYIRQLADELRIALRREEAATAYPEAIELFAAAGDRVGEARVQLLLGRTLHDLKRYPEALAAYQRAIGIRAAIGDAVGEAYAWAAMGDTRRMTGDLTGAIACHQQAASIHRQEANRKGRISAIKALSRDLAKIRHLDVNNLVPAEGDPGATGRALLSIADAMLELGRPGEAVPIAERAARIMRELRDQKAESWTQNVLGRGLYGLKRFEEAAAAHRRDLALSIENRDRHREGIARGNIGYTLHALIRFEEAAAAWREAAAVLEDIGELEDLGWTLDGLGGILLSLRQYEEAAATYERAIEILRQTPDRLTEISATSGVGITRFIQRRYDEAADAFGSAAKLADKAGEWGPAARLRGYRIGALIRFRWQRLRRGSPAELQDES
jgi:tetratricopeptide (TPR) repeat protein